MSHVDEGVLHAYLDGGLSALDAVRVERHVADCGACRQRLDQARALIQRAARLLEWASPPADRAAPPLADLRPAVAPRWRVPVAWAATIVVALGVGIYGGRILLQRTERDAKLQTSSGPAELFSSRDAVADRRAAPITVLAESVPRPDAAKATTTPTEPADAERVAGAVVLRDSTALNRQAQTAVAQARPDSPLLRSRIDSNALAAALVGLTPSSAAAERGLAPGARVADTTAIERREVAPSPARPPDPAGRVDEAPVAETRLRRAAGFALGTTWPVITRDSAARLLQTGIVALPDVPITSVRATNDGVVVEHVLPPGQVVRLMQRRVSGGEESNAAPGNELLARYIGGLRVEISGTLPADSLSRLLERVRVVP